MNQLLESQVSSLEPSKKLKSLGVNPDSTWSHVDVSLKGNPPEFQVLLTEQWGDGFEKYPALTVQEVLELLPTAIPIKYRNFEFSVSARLTIWKFDHLYQVAYNCEMQSRFDFSFSDKNLANALSEMLAHLIEKGLYGKDKN